ncbi:LppU family putative lipoprotein [Pseudonocardia lacus]|uniref:LppU family putative lipoprotein n=1 Tax=Pseudonocardia lacus TaxID=2835865 RepID=UPI001BDD53AF|nr:hypothetical protein [Pseudonocardia lacus]
MTTPGQYGGQAGADGPTRPVNTPGGYPQHGPGGTQYGPPAGGYPGQSGGYPQPQPGQGGGWPPQQGGGWPGPGPGQYPPFQPPGGGPPGPSSTKGMIIGIVVAVVVLLGGGGAAWYFLAGPGAADKGSTPVTPGGPSAAAPAAPVAPPSPTPAETGDVNAVDVEVGECVSLGGTTFDATVEEAACGSDGPTFIVTAKTESSDECSPDSDQWFYETRNNVEQGALCLDIDWVQGDCFEMSGELPERVACTSQGLDTVRVGETITGTTDASQCPEGAYTYDNRKMVVCLDQV